MNARRKSRNSLDGKIINIRRGLAIYKVRSSPFYRVRVWIPSKKKRITKTTKATTRVEAMSLAEELFSSMGVRGQLAGAPKDKTFEHFADRLTQIEEARGKKSEISPHQAANTGYILRNPRTGPIKFFGNRDIREIQTKDYLKYMAWVRAQDPNLSTGTRNHIAIVFRKVLSLAQTEGLIDAVPPTPREKRKDNPRPFFRFHPIANKRDDEYELLKSTAEQMASEGVCVRGSPVTGELKDFIEFMIQTFLRPTESEVYALRYRDVTLADGPDRLILMIRKGKTGQRSSITLSDAKRVLLRIMERNDARKKDDYIFLPAYKNRSTAKRIMQRQFNAALERAGLKKDRVTNSDHTVYSLRHTAICMRLVLSHGKVNIFNLAKNAGTSVDQIERFYARNLPLGSEMARNLQSVGEG